MKDDKPLRCPWCEGSELYQSYHDREWGVPTRDDAVQFEFLVLESAQAGLSWLTVLKKRENYRRAYDGFDAVRVAGYGPAKVTSLLADAGIVRNRLKIESSINNAACFLRTAEQFGSFSAYLWGFAGGRPLVNRFRSLSEVPAKTELSDRMAKDLKQRGFRFLGSTIVYAHLQATGLVNDHLVDCFRHSELAEAGHADGPR